MSTLNAAPVLNRKRLFDAVNTIEPRKTGASFKIYDAEINSGSVLANSATFVDEVSFSDDTVQSYSPELIGYSLNLYKIAITAHRSE